MSEGNNMTQLRCFSYGGGVQSTAALVLAAKQKAAMLGDTEAIIFLMEMTQGRLDLAPILHACDFSVFLFSNVGDDSEHPATLAYVRDVAMPWATRHGIELLELPPLYSGGKTLMERQLTGNTPDIPVYLQSGAPASRGCTNHYKVERINQELRRRLGRKPQAIIGLGISLDEYQRMRTNDPGSNIQREYPLIDLRLSRADCTRIIQQAGLPVPPKSSCFFCPFKTIRQWQDLKRETPELFERAIFLETAINVRRQERGKDLVFLSRSLQPLDQAIAGNQAIMDFDDACESGFCMT